MEEAVSDVAWLRAMLRFESQLALAEAELGIIPAQAAATISAACADHEFDLAAIGAAAVESAQPVVAIVDALRLALPDSDRAHVHFGATSQDTMDTAMMLVARDGLAALLADLRSLANACADLATRHRDTPMVGRTLLQRAEPITFGLKAANWLLGILESRRLATAVRNNRLALQLGGAAGTLAAFGPRAFELSANLARRLDLAATTLPWHGERSRVAEIASVCAIASGSAGKVAHDLVLLAQTEVGEVSFRSPGRSSAMPHKRNPTAAILAETCSRSVAGPVLVLIEAMRGDHERSAGAWQAEWPALTDAFRYTAGAVGHTLRAVTDLEVDPGQMLSNLHLAQGRGAATGAAGLLVDRALDLYREECDD